MVEGLLVYQWYDRYYFYDSRAAPPEKTTGFYSANTGGSTDKKIVESTGAVTVQYAGDANSGENAAESAGETTAPEANAEPITTDLVQQAVASNIIANSTYIDNPLTNGKPDALLLLLQARGPDNAANYPHQIGVWYDRNRGGRWAIFNQNLEPMEEGSTFKVAVLEGTTGFVHRAKLTNIEGNRTYLNNSLTNGDPNAVLSATRNWNPGGRGGVYNDHPVGVLYDKSVEKWAIFNKDDASMPVGAAFNIAVRRHNR